MCVNPFLEGEFAFIIKFRIQIFYKNIGQFNKSEVVVFAKDAVLS